MSNIKFTNVELNYVNSSVSDQTYIKTIVSKIEDVIETIAHAVCDSNLKDPADVIQFLQKNKSDYLNYCLRNDYGPVGDCNGPIREQDFINRMTNKLAGVGGIPSAAPNDFRSIIAINLKSPLTNKFINNPILANADETIANIAGLITDTLLAGPPNGALITTAFTGNAYNGAAGGADPKTAIANLVGSIGSLSASPANKLIVENVVKAMIDELQLIIKEAAADKTIFNQERIKYIVDAITNDTLFQNNCKFKKSVVNGQTSTKLEYIGSWPRFARYNLGRINNNVIALPISIHTVPGLHSVSGGGVIENILMNGDDESKELLRNRDSHNKLGVYVDKNQRVRPIKYLDFDDFENDYDDYHLNNNIGKVNVKVCKINFKSNKIDCNTYNDSDSEEYNVNTHGLNKEYENAFKILKIFRNSESVDEVVDNLEYLLYYLKYYVLPIKTFEKAKKIYHKQNKLY